MTPLWGTRANWPHLLLRSVREHARGEGLVLPSSSQHHLVLAAEGRFHLAVRVGGQPGWQRMYLLEGDVLLRCAGSPVHELRWEAPGPVHLVHAHLSPALFAGAPALLPSSEPFVRIREPLVEHLLRSLDRAARAPRAGDARYAALAAELLAAHLLRSSASEAPVAALGGLPPLVLRRVCEHIERHIEQPLRLGELASVAGLSPFYFARAFKAATGQTPHSYVRTRRVAAVERLLRETDQPLAELAEATGFSSQSRLTTAFRAATGETPAQYRRDRQSKNG